jgi:uncharacterized protein
VQSSMQQEQMIAALRGAYAAFNRGDIDAAVEPLDDQIEWIEPTEFPGGGTYHGRDGAKRYLTQSREGLAEGTSEPEKFMMAGNRVVVFVHAHVRPKGSGEWLDVRGLRMSIQSVTERRSRCGRLPTDSRPCVGLGRRIESLTSTNTPQS